MLHALLRGFRAAAISSEKKESSGIDSTAQSHLHAAGEYAYVVFRGRIERNYEFSIPRLGLFSIIWCTEGSPYFPALRGESR